MYNYFSIAFWFISFYSRWLHVTLQTHTNFKVQGLALLFFLVFNWGRVCLFAYCLFGGFFFEGWVLVFGCFQATITFVVGLLFRFILNLVLGGSNAWILIIEIIPLIKLATCICNFKNYQPSKTFLTGCPMIALSEDPFFKDNACLHDLHKAILSNLVNMLTDSE